MLLVGENLFGNIGKNIIGILLIVFFPGLVAIVLGERFCGRNISWYQGVKKSMKKLIPLILLNLAIGLMVFFGFFLLVIPGIIIAFATTCAIPAMMLEDLGPMEAWKRSWKLTKKNRFRIFGLFCLSFLTIILVVISAMPISAVVGSNPFALYMVGVPLMMHLLLFFQVLGPAITTFLFFDLRIRKELVTVE